MSNIDDKNDEKTDRILPIAINTLNALKVVSQFCEIREKNEKIMN